MTDWKHIKDDNSGRTFKIEYKNHKSNVEACTWVDGNKITKFGTDEEAAYWAMQQAIYQVLHYKTGTQQSQ